MGIERFIWTAHAELRRTQRRLDAEAIEEAIQEGHADRKVNEGRAQWIIEGSTADGVRFEAIYDHPHGDDEEAARIVSVWHLA
jgi:Domain of unknown function (DUF4258)